MTTRNEAFAQALFKRTSGGWVYRAPNPSIFGGATHYLVSDEQKEQITAILMVGRPVALGLSLAGLLGLWVCLVFGIARLFGFDFDGRMWGQLGILFLVIVAAGFAAMSVNAAIQLHRIKPVLVGAPITSDRISYREIREMAARRQPARSARLLFGLGVLWLAVAGMQVVNLILRQPRHPFFSDALSYFMVLLVVLSVGLAIWQFVQAARLKARVGRDAR
jgi:hypothetical protein